MVKLSPFDVSEYLKDEPTIAAYLSAVVEEGDIALLLSAIGDIAKARGMSKIASETGMGRESLYKALNPESKPRFETVIKVLEALGVEISFAPKQPKEIQEKGTRTRTTPAQKKIRHSSKSGFKRKFANKSIRAKTVHS